MSIESHKKDRVYNKGSKKLSNDYLHYTKWCLTLSELYANNTNSISFD